MAKSGSDEFAETSMLPHAPGAVEHPTLESTHPTSDNTTELDHQALEALGPGSRISHFILERKLGEGGMGVVFLARDNRLQRDVAIKILRLGRGHESNATQAQQRMLREAQAMAMLGHPNLVTIYEVGTFAKSVFLAMEYVVGQTLDEWLDHKHSLDEVFEVFEQAGRALGAVHEAGLVHRDFKPANVVVTEAGVAKVLDLGIARKLARFDEDDDDQLEPDLDLPFTNNAEARARLQHLTDKDAFDSKLTREGAIVGTPAYMPPEQLLGASVGPAADQFSFAIALFEALTGNRPFLGDDPITVMANIVGGERQPWPEHSDVPDKLREAIERALNPDPKQRFPSMAEFLEACQQAMGLRGQIRFLTTRWQTQRQNADFLLREGALLNEGKRLLRDSPDSLTPEQADFLQSSWKHAKSKRLRRRLLLGGTGALALGLIPTTWLLERRSRELEQATRAELTAEMNALRDQVEFVFARAEEQILLMFAQRDAWLPAFHELVHTKSENPDGDLLASVAKLNAFFRPVVERTPSISSLMVARDDGAEYLVFDDPDARKLSPAYRFYNRIVHRPQFGDDAFQVFWPTHTKTPRLGWLRAGATDSRGQRWDGYHPTRRPWFQSALGAKQRQVAWTKPYLFFVTKDAGITGSVAFRANDRTYVLGVDFMLTHLSTLTSKIETSRFVALVTTGDSKLVGLPKSPRFDSQDKVREFFVSFDEARRTAAAKRKGADVSAELPEVGQLGMPALDAAVKQASDSNSPIFTFEVEGQTLWAARAPMAGQDLMIHVVERPKH